MMKRLLQLFLTAVFSATLLAGDKPEIENKEWEEACGGSNIQVTRVAGKLVLIEAYVEHYSEAREWMCLYQDGHILSAIYKHSLIKRIAGSKEGEYTTKTNEDQVKVFHFPNHQLEGMNSSLLKDLQEVITIANSKKPDSK